LILFEFKEQDAGKPLKATCFQPLLTNSKLTKDVLLLFELTKIELVMVCASLMTHRPVQKCPTVALNQQEEPKLLIYNFHLMLMAFWILSTPSGTASVCQESCGSWRACSPRRGRCNLSPS
jgi:hypothetical protein